MVAGYPPTLGLAVRGLSRHFGALVALQGVSFDIHPGEVLGLIGPNGSGKTTLFECLAGLQPPHEGRIETTAGAPVSPRERSSVLFYVPDGARPWSDQPVSWALDFTLGFFGGPAAQRDPVVRDLDLAPLMRRRMGALSKGQTKRVLLAIGLLTPQPILQVDEPFEGLDLRQTREVARTLRAHAAAGRTIFLSIHQIADAARVCDRFVFLSGGRVCGEGTLAELAARTDSCSTGPDLEEVFLALT